MNNDNVVEVQESRDVRTKQVSIITLRMFSIGVEHEFSVSDPRISYLHSTFCGPVGAPGNLHGQDGLTDGHYGRMARARAGLHQRSFTPTNASITAIPLRT